MLSVIRRSSVAVATSGALALGIAAVPASAATQQSGGLVNVALVGNTVQVPVGIAANICNVQANVIASNNFGGNSLCTSASRATATGGGGGGGNTSQNGLVNVAITGNTVQVPVGVAANICNVQANVIATGNFGGNGTCSSIAPAGA
jgi:hypothetical protein